MSILSFVNCSFFFLIIVFNSWSKADSPYSSNGTNTYGVNVYGDIKRALNLGDSSENLNWFIGSAFNHVSRDPTYMFILPNERHSRVVMRRHDFKRPVFPNITALTLQLGRISARRYFDEDSFQTTSPSIGSAMTASPVIEDEDITAENVRTESIFIDYMNGLNKKLEDLLTKLRKNQEILDNRAKQLTNVYKPKAVHFPLLIRSDSSEWKAFGLSGWRGEIVPGAGRVESISENLPASDAALLKASQRESRTNPGGAELIPLQWTFLDDGNGAGGWDLPGKTLQGQTPGVEDLNELFTTMSKVLNVSSNSKWPIANPRSAHKNKDVFIARANNPFGYSTKWELKAAGNSTRSRKKRGIGELYSMLKCATGCDPLLLKGYGCYCGFLGAGTPIDGIDRCCQAHDQCYARTKCPMYLLYFVPYLWKCYDGRPLCAVDNGEWGHCATQLCKCDLSLSTCTRKYKCPRRRTICRTNKLRMLQNYLRLI